MRNTENAGTQSIPLVPLPAIVRIDDQKSIPFGPGIEILRPQTLKIEADHLQELLDAKQFATRIIEGSRGQTGARTRIVLQLSAGKSGASPAESAEYAFGPEARTREAYTLDIGPGADVRIVGNSAEGVFRGIRTLVQILSLARAGHLPIVAGKLGLPPAESVPPRGRLLLPVIHIEDEPRFRWRGVMLDSARHFIPVDYILRHLDLMASAKLNVFHWHLCDDQGWRFPVVGHPKLIEIASHRSKPEPHRGFYSEDEIRTVVERAKTLHIMIVPECDIPGHASAALSAYPNLGCDGDHAPHVSEPLGEWGIFPNLLCPGKESTFDFVRDVMKQFVSYFPGPYIHMGGDEVKDISSWENCPHCRKRMQEEGLKDARELEGYFAGRVEEIIKDLGRLPMAWDDVVHAVKDTKTLLQFWSDKKHLADGRKKGHDFVLSPPLNMYLDMSYAEPEPKRWAGYVPLPASYETEPALFGLSDSDILGFEAALWTEHTPDAQAMDRQLWPRLFAVAEVCWTPKTRRSWEEFGTRLPRAASVLVESDVVFYHSPEIKWLKA